MSTLASQEINVIGLYVKDVKCVNGLLKFNETKKKIRKFVFFIRNSNSKYTKSYIFRNSIKFSFDWYKFCKNY